MPAVPRRLESGSARDTRSAVTRPAAAGHMLLKAAAAVVVVDC